MRARPLRGERRAQRSRRQAQAVADSDRAVDHRDGEVLDQGRVLQPVIHDDDAGAAAGAQRGAGWAVARDDRRKGAGEQQGLVADVSGRMHLRIDADGTGKAAAVAAGQEERPHARLRQQGGEGERGRRLARAADREIADAHDRERRPGSGSPHPPAGDGPVDESGRLQQAGDGGGMRPPPEGGRPHQITMRFHRIDENA